MRVSKPSSSMDPAGRFLGRRRLMHVSDVHERTRERSRAGRCLRIATYNVHKCRGLDRRVLPERIADVLREIDADIVALQEVVSVPRGPRTENQAAYIAEELGLHYHLGSNRSLRGGEYGNVLLSRFPVRATRNFNLSVPRREPRGCLRADVELSDATVLHVFNVHLGTAPRERKYQGWRLAGSEILNSDELEGPRIMLGDFNEWTRGLASRLMSDNLNRADLRGEMSWWRTYPGFLPVLNLDHVYHDSTLRVERFRPHRSRTALVASDHLPLVADFMLQSPQRS